MYTDGACRLAFWRDADYLVCEARDSGRFDDPLVGRLDPGRTGPASRGLYLVNAISDLVRTHTASTGTTIQAYQRMAPVRPDGLTRRRPRKTAHQGTEVPGRPSFSTGLKA